MSRKPLNELTKEDYQKVLSEIQASLSACVGELIIFGGFLDSDYSLDSENTHYVLITAKNIVQAALTSVKKALSFTCLMV